MPERDIHQQVQRRLDHLLCSAIQNLAATVGDEEMQNRLRNVRETGTGQVALPGLNACPDMSFAEFLPAGVVGMEEDVLRSLVVEIC